MLNLNSNQFVIYILLFLIFILGLFIFVILIKNSYKNKLNDSRFGSILVSLGKYSRNIDYLNHFFKIKISQNEINGDFEFDGKIPCEKQINSIVKDINKLHGFHNKIETRVIDLESFKANSYSDINRYPVVGDIISIHSNDRQVVNQVSNDYKTLWIRYLDLIGKDDIKDQSVKTNQCKYIGNIKD